ncbi:MAG: ABC transporter ATP-binding protein [Alphaproteobacteria bacterium]|nr:ABC transporter ATP-binding protein [Alphaproteobacteria bacterium]
MSGPVLVARDIVGGYAAADEIVKGISLEVAAGEIVAIIGPNGAGKSTFLKIVAGLLVRRRGTIALAGEEIGALTPQARAQRGLVFVPQERNVFGSLSVAENLEMGGWLDPRAAKAREEGVLARFPILRERRRQLAKTLSGGQRQMLAMGVALMGAPKVLLLDEPTAGLSPRAAGELFDSVRRIRDEGVAILMVEQNALDALAIADRGAVFVDGREAYAGRALELADDPDVRRLFLGGRKRDVA